MNILFTGFRPSILSTLTQTAYMSLFEKGSTSKYPDLQFQALDVVSLAEGGDLGMLREACKAADFIYHYGIVFQDMMLEAGASEELVGRAHKIIFEEFGGKSVCRNEVVCESHNPDRKDFHYKSVRQQEEEKEVPLIPSISFSEMKRRFDSGEEIPLPQVFKDPRVDNGWGCLLIENSDQLAKLFDDDLYNDPALAFVTDVSNLLDERQMCLFQEFIISEPNHPLEESHARVLVHASASKILGMAFFHAKKPQESAALPGINSRGLVSIYTNPRSPLYLAAKKVKPSDSNTIPVYPHTNQSKPLVSSDVAVLSRHGIEVNKIPPKLEVLAIKFGEIMSKNGMGGLIGIDVIHDPTKDKWYLLEGNFPASGMFSKLYGHRSYQSCVSIRVDKVLETWQEKAAASQRRLALTQ